MHLNRFLIVAEITDEDLRCGFILGFVEGQAEAKTAMNEHHELVRNSKQHWYDFYKDRFPAYQINGDDYINAEDSISYGFYTMSCIKANKPFTLERFISERQQRTSNYDYEQLDKLVNELSFEEISNPN